MILYTLRCDKNHHFEEWFSNSADCDSKTAAGALSCPECGSTQVGKAIMAPSIGGASSTREPAPCGAPSCGHGMCPAMHG
ncbi:MAG: hypothetical protein A2516_07560 [Alphaproteobacteria bacterium RIFOXYD12_FULL_60_8]|nr:MAG: hypothetical protein A2516_07560 [Alphaproteobacteria bacterium RIFOXYD12_FULL_60_8]